MRHKYETPGIVLSRAHLGEMSAYVTILTPDLGLVHARAQGLRRSGAKLAAALATFAESELVLVRGKEGWRIAGAVLSENWFTRLPDADARSRAARIAHLLLRLVAGETRDPELFSFMREFFSALARESRAERESAEVLAALLALSRLGLDAGEIPGSGGTRFSAEALADIAGGRSRYIARVNQGIVASGL